MVQISKDAIYILSHSNGGDAVEESRVKLGQGIVSVLSEPTIVDDDVTVYDFLLHLDNYAEQIDYIFDSSLNGLPLSLFVADGLKPSSAEADFSFVEIIRDVGCDEYGMYEVCVMQGVMREEKDSFGEPKTLEFMPICDYAHCPLLLNPWYVIHKDQGKEVLFSAIKPYTLYEVIHGFLFEVSFHGIPEDREALRVKLEPVIAKEEIADLERQLEESVDAEDYEKSIKIRDRIHELRNQAHGAKIKKGHI